MENDNQLDQQIELALLRSIENERQVRTTIAGYLREIDERKLWRNEGCRSIREFCIRVLNYDEFETRDILIEAGLILTTAQLRDPDPDVQKRIDDLLAWRKDISIRSMAPAYRFLTNRSLLEIAKKNPTTLEQLAEIQGVGARKLNAHGAAILEVLRAKSVAIQ